MPLKETIEKTRERWQPFYDYPLSDDDCYEIHNNVAGFMGTIQRFVRKKMMKIEVRKPTQEELNELGIDNWGTWSCEVSRFDWQYQEKETCYLFEGEVTVETEWETVNFGAGDLVVFPAGLKCVWDVKKPVRKVYKFD